MLLHIVPIIPACLTDEIRDVRYLLALSHSVGQDLEILLGAVLAWLVEAAVQEEVHFAAAVLLLINTAGQGCRNEVPELLV